MTHPRFNPKISAAYQVASDAPIVHRPRSSWRPTPMSWGTDGVVVDTFLGLGNGLDDYSTGLQTQAAGNRQLDNDGAHAEIDGLRLARRSSTLVTRPALRFTSSCFRCPPSSTRSTRPPSTHPQRQAHLHARHSRAREPAMSNPTQPPPAPQPPLPQTAPTNVPPTGAIPGAATPVSGGSPLPQAPKRISSNIWGTPRGPRKPWTG